MRYRIKYYGFFSSKILKIIELEEKPNEAIVKHLKPRGASEVYIEQIDPDENDLDETCHIVFQDALI